jgi:hypothetical protein
LGLYHTNIPEVARRETPFGVDRGHSIVVTWEKSLHLMIVYTGVVLHKDLWILFSEGSNMEQRATSAQGERITQ